VKTSFPLTISTLENRPGGYVFVRLQASPNFPVWKPGQFLSLRKTIGGKPVIRSYSIASLPGEGLSLLVRREANGVFSRWLADNALPGDTMETLAPSGSFVLPDLLTPIDNLVLLAAGSGIAPIRPLALQALAEGPNSFAYRVHLLYSAFSEDTAPFLDEFSSLTQHRNDLILKPFLSHTGSIKANRLNNLLLEEYLAANLITPEGTNLFFICGPISYRRMARFTLRTMGFSTDQIREENFDLINTQPPKRPVLEKDATIKAIFPNGTEARFVCAPHENILSAGLRNGVDMPYSCRGGVCSSCTAVLLSGKTHMTINEILGPDDLARHLTLTCTALPASDEITIKLGTLLW
jgi:ring-1,2-phenylacetyl-CoA epoxidase subunit PaaE